MAAEEQAGEVGDTGGATGPARPLENGATGRRERKSSGAPPSPPYPASVSAQRQLSRSLPAVDPDALRRRGYALVRGVFDAAEVAQLRTAALETVAELEGEGRMGGQTGAEGTARGGGDLIGLPRLRHLLYDPRVVHVVERLLGGRPVYFGDSTLRVGKTGIRAWHRDNVERRRWRGGPDWQDPPYPLLRCGVYLQDQAHHSGGLALRPRSNGPGRVRPTLPKLVDARAGDLLVWDLRTVHSGEVVRLRGTPRLPLHPRLQTLLPSRLRVPDDGERIVMFMAFALAGAHLDHYLEYLKRDRPEMLESWSDTHFGPDEWAAAEDGGLRMLAPVEAYDRAPPDRATA